MKNISRVILILVVLAVVALQVFMSMRGGLAIVILMLPLEILAVLFYFLSLKWNQKIKERYQKLAHDKNLSFQYSKGFLGTLSFPVLKGSYKGYQTLFKMNPNYRRSTKAKPLSRFQITFHVPDFVTQKTVLVHSRNIQKAYEVLKKLFDDRAALKVKSFLENAPSQAVVILRHQAFDFGYFQGLKTQKGFEMFSEAYDVLAELSQSSIYTRRKSQK